MPEFHYEQISRACVEGVGAQVVGEGADGGVQGFRVGERIWGVQFHPELELEDVRRLVAHHRHTIETHHNTVAAALASVDTLGDRWSQRTFDRILDRVTGSAGEEDSGEGDAGREPLGREIRPGGLLPPGR